MIKVDVQKSSSSLESLHLLIHPLECFPLSFDCSRHEGPGSLS